MVLKQDTKKSKCLLDLPCEIRSKIFAFALRPFPHYRASRVLEPAAKRTILQPLRIIPNRGPPSLFLTCKQIMEDCQQLFNSNVPVPIRGDYHTMSIGDDVIMSDDTIMGDDVISYDKSLWKFCQEATSRSPNIIDLHLGTFRMHTDPERLSMFVKHMRELLPTVNNIQLTIEANIPTPPRFNPFHTTTQINDLLQDIGAVKEEEDSPWGEQTMIIPFTKHLRILQSNDHAVRSTRRAKILLNMDLLCPTAASAGYSGLLSGGDFSRWKTFLQLLKPFTNLREVEVYVDVPQTITTDLVTLLGPSPVDDPRLVPIFITIFLDVLPQVAKVFIFRSRDSSSNSRSRKRMTTAEEDTLLGSLPDDDRIARTSEHLLLGRRHMTENRTTRSYNRRPVFDLVQGSEAKRAEKRKALPEKEKQEKREEKRRRTMYW